MEKHRPRTFIERHLKRTLPSTSAAVQSPFSAAVTLCTCCWASLNARGDLFILNNCRGHFKCFMEMPSCDSDLPERGLMVTAMPEALQRVKCLQLDLVELQTGSWLSTGFP